MIMTNWTEAEAKRFPTMYAELVWFRPAFGDRAGQRVVVRDFRSVWVHDQARLAGVKYDPETKTYGF